MNRDEGEPDPSTVYSILEIVKEQFDEKNYQKASEYLNQANNLVEKLRRQLTLRHPAVADLFVQVSLFREALQKANGEEI